MKLARNKYLACLFIRQTDGDRYNVLKKDISNDCLCNRKGYPKTVKETARLFTNFQFTDAKKQGQNQARQGAQQRDDASVASTKVAFTEVVNGRGRNHTPNSNRGLACFHYGKEGHIVKECPDLIGSNPGTTAAIYRKTIAARASGDSMTGVGPIQRPAQSNNNDTKASATKPEIACFNNRTVNAGSDDNSQLPTTNISYQDRAHYKNFLLSNIKSSSFAGIGIMIVYSEIDDE